jgi:chromosome partitioning protein
MKTHAFIAQKGGSGKTTLAVHMAVCAIRQNLRTALIDLDPQGSAYDWNESRNDGNKLDAVKANPGQLAALLKQAITLKLSFIAAAQGGLEEIPEKLARPS